MCVGEVKFSLRLGKLINEGQDLGWIIHFDADDRRICLKTVHFKTVCINPLKFRDCPFFCFRPSISILEIVRTPTLTLLDRSL